MKRIILSFLALTLCLFVFLGVVPTEANAATVIMEGDISYQTYYGDDVDYVLYSDGRLVISGTGQMDEYLSTAPWETCASTIKKVVIKSGVTNIGHYAFQDCLNLSSVTIPDTVTSIGSYAFEGCVKLTTVTLPASVSTIGSYAFSGTSLTSVTIPGSVKEMGYSIFYGCTSLSSVTLKSGVLAIGESMFSGCSKLSKITIPGTVLKIGSSAFYNCSSLASITIPSSVCDIGSNAFEDCTALTSVSLPALVTVSYSLFRDCTKLASVTIPNGPSSIGSYAFYNCSSLEEISIPKSVTEIGSSAFGNCTALKSVTLVKGLVSIGSSAFNNCESLEAITIPASVTTIGNYAFEYCDELDKVTFKGNAPVFASNVFYCTTTRCYYPKDNSTWTSSVMQDYSGTIFWLKNGTKLSGKSGSRLTWTLDGNNVLTISGKGAMPDYNSWGDNVAPWYSARKLVDSIVVSSGVTRIGNNAFYDCYNAASATIADTVLRLGSGAFDECEKLASITLPESLVEIGYASFADCVSLKKITIPQSVTKIGGSAFSNCDGLTSIKVPANVTELGYSAFSGCDNLKTATVSGSVGYLDSNVFYNCANLETVSLGSGIKSIGYGAFYDCAKLKSVSIPKTVEYIYDNAFYDCARLESITLPSSLKGLGSYVFYGCYNLESITIPANVEYINSYAFAECSNLESITFQGKAPRIGNEAFMNVFANAYYTKGDTTWTSAVKKDYGGMLTWKAIEQAPAEPVIKAGNVSSTGKIKISWEKVDRAAKYQVYRATSKNGTYTRISTTTGTSVTNTKAVAGTTYYYKVKALTESGKASEFSNIVSRTCDLARPSNIKATNVASTGKIKITWDKVEGASKYEVYRATSKDGTYTKLITTSGTSITNTSATAGKTYYYKIKAIHSNSNANSALTGYVSKTCDLARPDVTVTLNSSGKPYLKWDKVSGATKYEVYRATSKDGTYKLLKTTTGTSLTNSSATVGKTYYYKVRAIHSNSNANSAYSSIDSIRSK